MRTRSVLFHTALVAAAACGRAAAGRAGLVYYESYDPRSLDPALSTDVPTGEMVTLVFDGLTQFDPDGRLEPALADRWTASGDGRPWPLYPTTGAEAYAAGRAGDVSGITLEGDSGVAFALTEPLAIFPKFLAMPVASVVPPPPPLASDLGQQPIGTGRWRFVAWQHDDALTFARNPDYWGGAPLADTLIVRIVPEPLTRAAEFEAGRLSVIEVPFGETARWRAQHPDWLVEKPALRVVYVALNNRRGPLSDARVRQALNQAVNVPEILATVYGRRGVLARGAIPPALPGSDTTRPAYDYDPAAARRLLAQAGYATGIDLQLWRTAANVELSRAAQAIQSQLAAVGVRVELVERDASSQREAARKGQADMVILDWWADYPDADNFLYPLFYSGSAGPGGNYAFYADPGTDSLILRARRTTNDTARTTLYRRIDERVYRAAPWLYLWFPTDLWARRPELVGWDLPVIFNGQRWTLARVAPR